jgi:hypothetical protein
MKWKRIVRALAGGLALLLIGVALDAWISHARRESRLEALRAAGDPVSLADLTKRDVTPAINVCSYLTPIRDDAEALYNAIHPYAHADGFNWRAGLSPEQVAGTTTGIAKFPQVFPAIERAAGCNQHAADLDAAHGVSAFVASSIVAANQMRTAARLLDCRGRYLGATGHPDEAAKAYLVGLQLTRLQDQEPTLMIFLVNIACRSIAIHGLNGLLQTSSLTAETHAAIEAELARHDAMDQFVHALRTERAVGIESFGELPGLPWVTNSAFISYLDVLDQQLTWGATSQHEIAGLQRVNARGIAAPIDPTLDAARESLNRSRAMFRCLRVLNQLRARAVPAEEFSINTLGIPRDATLDPYSGKPLTIRHTDTGRLVYSVGKNLRDDGGKLDNLSDIGVGPPEIMAE